MEAEAKRGWRVVGEAVPNNLPRYLTSFVGRAADLHALKSLLARSRMVTITGPGGAGKSRLAAELGRACLDLWPGGVWWVELGRLSDPRQVAGAVVAALKLTGRGPAVDVATAWLAPRRALLVLDNCEHLVAACAEFSQAALQRCAELTIIVTSREVLGVLGEARWPVASMAAADAALLFEVRARLVVFGFKVVASNLETVTQICERLDGMPLAIELAAARLAMMTEQEILSHLSDRFRLLMGGNRSAPARQQTMIATIDWSYRLLTGDEALLFRRLAVFRGGFTLESAHAICGDGIAGSVLELLAGLVQKSMVVAERADGPASRYRLPESQLAYSEERLRESGELEHARRRHYEFFRDSLSTKMYTSSGPRAARPPPDVAEAVWISNELTNLLTAMEWARNNADDLGLSLAVDLSFIWFGDITQSRSTLTDLLERSRDKGFLRVRALRGVSNLAAEQGDYESTVRAAEASVALARELGNNEELANSLFRAGEAHALREEFDTAVELHQEATSLLKGSSNRRLITKVRGDGIAGVAIRRGDYIAAREILVECVAADKADGDIRASTDHLQSLGTAQWGLKDYQAAVATFKEALFGYRSMRDNLGIMLCLQCLSCVAGDIGDYRRAMRVAAAASRVSVEWSGTFEPWLRRRAADSESRSRSKLGARKSADAWKQGWVMSLEEAIDYALRESEPETVVDAGPLSRREQEVARLVAAGMTNRQIGERLFIAERTADGHVERIRNKLGVRSRTGIATWAVERGLISGQVATEPGSGYKRGTHIGPPSPRR